MQSETASKIFMPAASLIQGLRSGGTREESSGNRSAMSFAISSLFGLLGF